MLCRATQDRRIMVESSDNTWFTKKWNGKPPQYSCLENPMNSMKRQKDRTLKDVLLRSVSQSVQSLGYVQLLPLHGLQHARPPCSSSTPGVYSDSCPLSQWCHPTISSCYPLLLLPSIFPSIRVFPNESVLPIRWPKYWSSNFSISPFNEYSGLIFFRMDWLDLPAVQGTLKSLTPQFKNINSLVLSFLYSPTLTSIHNYWKNHSFD